MDIISKKDALEKGLKQYFTGKPCKHGHLSGRYVKTSVCNECNTIRVNHNRRTRAAYEIKRKQTRSTHDMLIKYGLSKEQYQQMIDQQDNACAICRNLFGATPHIDHCHTTGQVRGLLCRTCNVGIGMLGDTHESVQKAADYLNACYTDFRQ